jgi:hypothetical protein
MHYLAFAGVVQGIVTGVRGLCSGLGPAMFGVIFYLFHVDLSETPTERHTSAPVSLFLSSAPCSCITKFIVTEFLPCDVY